MNTTATAPAIIIPAGYAILIEIDTDFDPATSVDWSEAETAAYVAEFERGELTAYSVSVVRVDDDGDVISKRYGDGSYGPVRLASLWGCDVATAYADGVYTDAASIPDDYLRTIAGEVLSEI